mmetsp:Transcript_13945/g.19361  ORF Transcript_13945/g.19361 Transcript_13945/m.19361 type:complete len:130 (-) Transcript_13945:320-709(-)
MMVESQSKLRSPTPNPRQTRQRLDPMGRMPIAEPNFFPIPDSHATLLQMYSQWWWDKYFAYYHSGEIQRWWQQQRAPSHPNPHVHALQQVVQIKAKIFKIKDAREKQRLRENMRNETIRSNLNRSNTPP